MPCISVQRLLNIEGFSARPVSADPRKPASFQRFTHVPD
jgi:hypothetical protein